MLFRTKIYTRMGLHKAFLTAVTLWSISLASKRNPVTTLLLKARKINTLNT